MESTVGEILTGKVTGISDFGAFVSLENGDKGLVHISEISNTYIDDISKILQIGEEVKVKVVSLDKGKLSLSIKQAAANSNNAESAPHGNNSGGYSPNYRGKKKPNVPLDPFEEMMKKFKQASEEKQHDLKRKDGNKFN